MLSFCILFHSLTLFSHRLNIGSQLMVGQGVPLPIDILTCFYILFCHPILPRHSEYYCKYCCLEGCGGFLWTFQPSVKAVSPFIRSRSRHQCRCITVINRISTEAIVWLLLCGCVCVTIALLT